MPHLHALWVTSADDGFDHLVLDVDVRVVGNGRSPTVCGRVVLLAALICAPQPACHACRRYVDDLARNDEPRAPRRTLLDRFRWTPAGRRAPGAGVSSG